ncbi:Calycin-like protein [Artemisia annua]|uniref:Calycin-like protein n=1 Tax=Artemisia annua TaxID=35608 RepID=A0A2U1QBG5_ARTAN|nr:Calycin-like protein [Artemisia annua]
MQSPLTDASRTFYRIPNPNSLSFLPSSSSTFPPPPRQPYSRVYCNFPNPNNRRRTQAKGKDNVWSIDNDMANGRGERRRKGERRKVKGRSSSTGRRRGGSGSGSGSGEGVMVSGPMLIETENVLQTQEPVIIPLWSTFASSVSGIWKGVGAVFSPITALMEPIEVGRNNEHQFDCYTLSRIEAVPPTNRDDKSHIRRTVNWVTLNPYGENKQLLSRDNKSKDMSVEVDASLSTIGSLDGRRKNHALPKFESFDFERSDVMEEDLMGMEPGLVFFEDGSYSRGPVDIPVGEVNDSNYFLSPTFKFEQCLVKGCHKRLRIVHTIEFSDGGSDIQIMRVAVYEEQWVSTANLPDKSDVDFDVKPFSQRKRVQPSQLTGSWKVFETSATPIYGEEPVTEDDSNDPPYVYLCTETLKKRNSPDSAVYFGEEEVLDMVDVTMLWLPGGVTAYVDVSKEGILCIGVGWYSDEGINLVMERDYGTDGKLKEVRSKTEVKRRWSEPPPF